VGFWKSAVTPGARGIEASRSASLQKNRNFLAKAEIMFYICSP
jgi:hypothetical protein